MSIEIRRIDADDWAAWREIRLRGLREAPEAFADSVRKANAANDHEGAYRSRISNAIACFLALDGDAPVGLVALDPMPDGRVQLMSMFVAPEVRRAGVGARLIDDVVAVAGERPLFLRVMDGNAAAVAAYEHSGFVLDPTPADDEGCLTMRHVRRESGVGGDPRSRHP